MGLFDDIGNTFNKVANTTIKKSKDISELTKLSLKQNTADSELINLYEEFGKYQYNVSKNIENEEIKDYVALIDAKLKEIADIKIDIEQLKGIIVCPNCGTKNKTEDSFCSNCGTKLPKPEPEEQKADSDDSEKKED